MQKLDIPKEKIIKVLKNMKPQKSIWGFLGVLLFFIAPEIIAFIYGSDITSFCESKLNDKTIPYSEYYLYENLEMLLGEGSYLNLAIGVIFLIWLFF
jgi:hypothetical protein